MDYNINFPNLGIYLKHVGKFIDINGFKIAYYGITIAIGMLLAFALVLHEAKITGQKQDDYYDIGLVGIVLGIIGARAYYVIFAWDEFKDNILSIFNLRGGGLAIYGGIIAAILTMIVGSKIKKINTWQVFDTISIGIILGQVIGRWGNFFNREVFGGYTNGLLAMQIPVNAVNDKTDITAQMLNNSVVIDGVKYISVHPTFLYESLWNLAVLIFLLIYKKHKSFQGEIFALYLALYGVGRFWIEGIRTDRLLIGGTNLAVSQVLSGVLVIASIFIILMRKKSTKRK